MLSCEETLVKDARSREVGRKTVEAIAETNAILMTELEGYGRLLLNSHTPIRQRSSLLAAAAGLAIAVWPGHVITPAHAQGARGTVAVLFDSSGSMWGNLPGGGAKFEVANAALLKALPSPQARVKTGLMVFGPGCTRVTTNAAPAVRPASETLAALKSLNPRSKGPIAAALEQSLGLFEEGKPASLVLVADGPDNCRQDPCTAAEKIASARPDLKIHVIGLGMSRPEPTLTCVSKLTKGQFVTVATAQEAEPAAQKILKLAMLDMQGKAKQRVSEKPKKGVRKKPKYDPNGPPQLVLSASLGAPKKGEELGKPVRWRVFKSATAPSIEAVPMLDVLEPQFSVPMASGDYWVKAALGRARFEGPAKIGKKGPAFFKAKFDAGLLKVTIDGDEGGAGDVPAMVTIRRAADTPEGKTGTPVIINPYRSAELILPAGQYDVHAESGPVTAKQLVSVETGATKTVNLNLRTGQLALAADTGLGNAVAGQFEFTVAVDDPDSPGGRRVVARSASKQPVFQLVAGTYYTEATLGLAKASGRIALGAGRSLSQVLKLDAARIKVQANIPPDQRRRPRPVVYRLYSVSPSKVVARSSKAAPEFIVSPGRYRVVADIGSRNVQSSQGLILGAREDAEVTLNVEAGDIKLRVVDADGRPQTAQFWEVFNNSGFIWRTQKLTPRALLAPGRYQVRSETRNGLVEGQFAVAAGETKTVELRVQQR